MTRENYYKILIRRGKIVQCHFCSYLVAVVSIKCGRISKKLRHLYHKFCGKLSVSPWFAEEEILDA